MVTIRKYLQRANPELHLLANTTQSTDSAFWEPIEEFEEFEEFNMDLLESLYGGVIDHNFDPKEDLPTPNPLLPVERRIKSERELEQDPLKRHVIAKVNYSLQAAYRYLRARDKEQSSEFSTAPVIVTGTKEPCGGPVPDWVVYHEQHSTTFLCGETKLSTVFQMQATVNAPDHSLDTPVEQCLHYCILKDTRYGFMISDKELVVLRIREEEIQPGLANQRTPRTAPAIRYSRGSSSLSSGMQSMSLYSETKPQGKPKFVEYRAIDWKQTDGLTVGLALFFITLIAYAPLTAFDIDDEYDELDRWEWELAKSYYRNNTSGRVRKALKKGQIEYVDWTSYKDGGGLTYFSSYRGQTYLQYIKTGDNIHLFDHLNQKWADPSQAQGLIRTYNDCIQW